MGLFDKLISKLTGGSSVESPSVKKPSSQRVPGEISATFTGPSGPAVEVSDAEVAERASAHAFVLTVDPPALKPAEAWWDEDVQKRRRRDSSDKMHAWLLPFVPIETINLPHMQQLEQKSHAWGPHNAEGVAKAIRALIRERRKSKERYDELLYALYGACIAADLFKSLSFEGAGSSYMARFVGMNDLYCVRIDYMTIGYQCIETLGKTDVKWLVETLGEPADHQSFQALWPSVRQNAIARYCWGELRSKNERAESHGQRQQSMKEWLDNLVRRNVGYYKEWQERVALRVSQLSELATSLEVAWKATWRPFVVADLETTGLSAEAHEILEFAAVLVAPDGTVTSEFSTLVRVAEVPPDIVQLTGITPELANRDGLPPVAAMRAFAEFVGAYPLFFHNAPFDHSFLKKAGARAKVPLVNSVHDTLQMARQAWPSLGTYKLATLADYVGAPAPTHRAMSDVRATLAVLLAARQKVGASAT